MAEVWDCTRTGRKARSAEQSKELGGGRATETVWDWVRAGGELLLWLEAFKTKKLLKPKSQDVLPSPQSLLWWTQHSALVLEVEAGSRSSLPRL